MIMTDLARHARVYRALIVQAVRRDAQFRAQAWTTGLVALAELGIGLVPVLVVSAATSRTGGINGWSAGGVIAVAGCFQVTLSVINTVVAPNLLRISAYVQRGDLDGLLLRPVDAQWLTLFRWISPAALSGALGGLVMIIIGLREVSWSPVALLVAIVYFGCGCWLVSLFWANFAYLAFWLEAANFIHDLVLETVSAGRYPVTFFPAAMRVAMIFVVPVGVAATLPVQSLTEGVPGWLGMSIIGLTLLATALTRVHWRLALRRYASASS